MKGHSDTGEHGRTGVGFLVGPAPVDEGFRQAGKCLSFDVLTWKLGVMDHHVVWVCETQDG